MIDLFFWGIALLVSFFAGLTYARRPDEEVVEPILFEPLPPKPLPEPQKQPVEPAPVPVKETTPKPVPKTPGVDYGPMPKLVKAIIQVESGGLDTAIGDKHLKDKAYGCMQIRKPVCLDVNRVYGLQLFPEQMLGNRQLSIDTFYDYMSIYATEKQLGRKVTDQDRARIWNGGPTGYKRQSTVGYWAKVSKHL